MGLIRHAAHCTMPQRQLPLHAGIPLPPPPSWRWMGSFSFLLALHFHHPRASCWHPLQQQRSSRSALAAALKTVGKSSKQTRFRTVGKSSTDPSPRQDCRLALNHFNVGWQVDIFLIAWSAGGTDPASTIVLRCACSPCTQSKMHSSMSAGCNAR